MTETNTAAHIVGWVKSRGYYSTLEAPALQTGRWPACRAVTAVTVVPTL